MRRAALRLGSIGAALALSACAMDDVSFRPDRTAPFEPAPQPHYPGYGSAVGAQPIPWTAETIARDFAELMFETEWGGRHETLLRWEKPVTVALAAPELEAYRGDVASLLAEIDARTKTLDISLTSAPRGDITLRTVARSRMRAIDPTALCFFVPVDRTWDEYVGLADTDEADWENVRRLDKVTVFIPAFAEPGVFRSCIVEEIAQALGPGNDLFRLEDSGYNDDAVHEWLTAFDLLMLEILYDPALSAGMTRRQATRAAERVARRSLGARLGSKTRAATSADKRYDRAIHAYLESKDNEEARAEITEARFVTRDLPPDDHRRGAVRRASAFLLNADDDVEGALDAMRDALDLFERTLPESSARLARARSDYGFFLAEAERYDEAISYFEQAETGLAANRIDQELTYTIYLRAVSLHLAGESVAGRRAARQALAWGAYVFGADSETVSRWRETFDLLERSV